LWHVAVLVHSLGEFLDCFWELCVG
jgi:hypothetical protein